MIHSTPLLTMIVFGFGMAFILGMIANRLHLSPIAGYLLAGVLMGPATPGYIGDPKMAHELAEIGVILLMFGVGLEFSWKELLRVRKIAVPGAIAQIVIATLMGWVLSLFMGLKLEEGLLFGIALSVASTVVLIRALGEQKLLSTNRGQIAVGWLIVEDLAVVVILVILPAIANILHPNVTDPSQTIIKGHIFLTLLITILKVSAFIILMLVVGKRVIPWILRITEKQKSAELFRLAILAIALGVAYGSAKLFGVSFALGAFFAGMILNESEHNHRAVKETIPLRDAFAVLFFVGMGMLLNPFILVESPWIILAVVMIIILGKSIVAYIIMKAFKHSSYTAFTIAISLAQIGEFSFILAELGVKLNMLTPEAQDIILASALISILLNPILFNLLDRFKPEKELE